MSSLRWQTVEALGLAFYIEKGCRVLTPLIDNKDYDFAIQEGSGEIKTVNVKKAYWDKGWAISRSGSGKDGPVDIFLAFLPVQQLFIELDGSFFDCVRSRSRKIPNDVIEEICNAPNPNSLQSSPRKVSRRAPVHRKRS